MKGAFLVDIDGTVALHQGHRDPYDWRTAEGDLPNRAVVTVVKALRGAGFEIVFFSGRPESAREITLRWLDTHLGFSGLLLLRADGDYRRDAVVKRELFDNFVAGRFDVLAVIDDRRQVVDMWRLDLGLTCFQVAPGDF